MTVYRKCRPCKHRDGCEIKAKLGAAIKGFGVGSISHRCREFEPEFRPGDNLWVRVQDAPHHAEDFTVNAVFPAHFVSYSKTLGRAIVYIARGAQSQCGESEFTPVKDGFCKVSYAPYRAQFPTSLDKGVVARREGKTPVNSCCGRPVGTSCDDCNIFSTEAAA